MADSCVFCGKVEGDVRLIRGQRASVCCSCLDLAHEVAFSGDRPLPTVHLLTLRRVAVKQAIREEDGSVVRAAKRLGVGRATLYRYLAEK